MKKFMLEEMGVDELEELRARDAVVLIPVGSIEAHGPLPYATDLFIVLAVSKMVAEKIDAVIFPPVAYANAGAVAPYPGSINISFEAQAKIVKEICLSAIEKGFRRILVVSMHHTNIYAIPAVVREIFAETRVPVTFFNPWDITREERNEFFKGWLDGDIEGSLLVPALKKLGKENIVDLEKIKRADSKVPKALGEIVKYEDKGTVVGWLFTDGYKHMPFTPKFSVERGEKILELAAERAIQIANSLKDYLSYLKEEGMLTKPEKS